MTTTLNASTAGAGGFIATSDNSGSLALQTAGITKLTVDSTGAYGQLISGTAVASTSGTSIEFISIPSWAKRITMMFNGVSAASGDNHVLQVGTGSTTYTTSGYLSTRSLLTSAVSTGNRTSGFDVALNSAGAEAVNGHAVLTNISGNTWILSSITGNTGDSRTTIGGGNIALGATLTAVRLICSATGSPSGAFDAGSINIMYEG
jgi:hypothetical protein